MRKFTSESGESFSSFMGINSHDSWLISSSEVSEIHANELLISNHPEQLLETTAVKESTENVLLISASLVQRTREILFRLEAKKLLQGLLNRRTLIITMLYFKTN
ncbi:hypothetical protein AVEN_153755-1 [Araneus ventricosus]|uniref:Uncharacterized protein n=1 Tax=Araneus ventricosus TaxID=182803 RepID=A0A4Y2KS67_ARAVE|nr:hypothetical protein AVEN_153755-1 [Araneus ventricosus]